MHVSTKKEKCHEHINKYFQHKKTRTALIAALTAMLALIAGNLLTNTVARADTIWISEPSLSSISFEGGSATADGTAFFSQVTSFKLNYTGSAASANKFAQLNMFALSDGLRFDFPSSAHASSSGCDLQVLSGDRNSCMFKLDAQGSASIQVGVVGASIKRSFKYLILSGPNIAQSSVGVGTFVTPVVELRSEAASFKALVGTASVMRFMVYQNGVRAPGIQANVQLTGIGNNLSSKLVSSDRKGILWIYVANTAQKHGSSSVKVTVKGTTTSATSKIQWLSGELN